MCNFHLPRLCGGPPLLLWPWQIQDNDSTFTIISIIVPSPRATPILSISYFYFDTRLRRYNNHRNRNPFSFGLFPFLFLFCPYRKTYGLGLGLRFGFEGTKMKVVPSRGHRRCLGFASFRRGFGYGRRDFALVCFSVFSHFLILFYSFAFLSSPLSFFLF